MRARGYSEVYARATTERTGDVGPAENDTDDELEGATGAESAALAAADTTEIRVEEALVLLGSHQSPSNVHPATNHMIH